MFESITQFAMSAGAIVLAGVFLVKSSDAIGELTKLGRLLAGTTLSFERSSFAPWRRSASIPSLEPCDFHRR